MRRWNTLSRLNIFYIIPWKRSDALNENFKFFNGYSFDVTFKNVCHSIQFEWSKVKFDNKKKIVLSDDAALKH